MCTLVDVSAPAFAFVNIEVGVIAHQEAPYPFLTGGTDKYVMLAALTMKRSPFVNIT